MPEDALDLSPFKTLSFRSSLPTEQGLAALEGMQGERIMGRDQMHGSAELAKLVTGRSWLGHLERVGVPAESSARQANFREYMTKLDALPALSTAWKDTAGSFATGIDDPSKLADVVLGAQVEVLNGIFMSAAASTPVVGWVMGLVQMGVGVGQMIWRENNTIPVKASALQLAPDEDTRVGNQLLDMAASADWTELFLPYHDPTQGSIVGHVPVEYGSGYKGGRFWLETPDGATDNMGQGLIPGGGVARMWQYRGRQASTGSSKLDRLLRWLGAPIATAKGFEEYTTYGFEVFRPSTEQIGQFLWAQLQVAGPAMFKLDAKRAREMWDLYWSHWVLGFNQLVAAGAKTDARLLLSVLFGNTGNSFPDWPARYAEGVPDQYRDWIGYHLVPTGKTLILGGGIVVEESIAQVDDPGVIGTFWVTRRGETLRYLDEFRARQRSALNSLTVAYLTGDEPGLSGGFREIWEDNRRQLLDDSALRKVDFTRVPAGPWKTEALKRKPKGLTLA